MIADEFCCSVCCTASSKEKGKPEHKLVADFAKEKAAPSASKIARVIDLGGAAGPSPQFSPRKVNVELTHSVFMFTIHVLERVVVLLV